MNALWTVVVRALVRGLDRILDLNVTCRALLDGESRAVTRPVAGVGISLRRDFLAFGPALAIFLERRLE
jgi:hypothetical protein